jgi:ribosomal small subunit protein bTHX
MGFDLGGHEAAETQRNYTQGLIPSGPLSVECGRLSPFNTRGHNLGKGDKRTFRGKVFKGSHGKSRPRKAKKASKKPA